ncbi:MAG TPA: urease accessory UreF family protein [Methylomirabilota bacterium]|jgi:urease accessory protein|nr:urease accessory UreF family protein [Methylomirabilota bacterium]
MTTDPLLVLLQLGDGLFPAGGFAHSFGLETYAQEGRVRDRAGLEAFVTAHLEGAAGPGDAVAVAVATRLAPSGDLAAWCNLDARLDAMKTVPEFRAASRQMGRQTARVATAVADGAFLAGLARAIDDGLAPGHHAAVFGAVAGAWGVAAEPAAAAYLYSTAALLVGAGLRLLTLGQLDGQRVLAAARPLIARLAADAARATADDMWTFTPALELAGLRHASLEMRLFRS